jgi:hypothetical protein
VVDAVPLDPRPAGGAVQGGRLEREPHCAAQLAGVLREVVRVDAHGLLLALAAFLGGRLLPKEGSESLSLILGLITLE